MEAGRRAPPGPWLYTGALENYPDLIEAITRERPLWGNPADVVRNVRSPLIIADVFQKAGIPCPALTDTFPTDTTRDWLLKPRRSAGGIGIRKWCGEPIDHGWYCQEWLEGDSCSALFVGLNDNSAMFLGATRQLVGIPWLNADAYHYCGNIGPLNLSPTIHARLQHQGNVLVQAFDLRGFFGVDFILKDDTPWPVEINPRYTAGIEVLERRVGKSLFLHHQEVFSPSNFELPLHLAGSSDFQIHGKAILFARAPLIFPLEGPWHKSLQHPFVSKDCPDYADIPHSGTRIEKGQPIITLFAQATTLTGCLDILRDRAQTLDRGLSG